MSECECTELDERGIVPVDVALHHAGDVLRRFTRTEADLGVGQVEARPPELADRHLEAITIDDLRVF